MTTDPSEVCVCPRLTLRNLITPDNRRGQLDGAWWPASTILAAEVPQLVTAAAGCGVEISRVMYCLDEWTPTVRRVVVEGRLIRLGGYRTQPVGTITIVGASDRRRFDLRLIAADTASDVALRRLADAAGIGPDAALLARSDAPATNPLPSAVGGRPHDTPQQALTAR